MSEKSSLDFEPIAEIAGQIEINLNWENGEHDPYEPLSEQTVLTIGKSGKTTRLTFKEPSSENIEKLITALEKAKKQLEKVEEFEQQGKHVEENVLQTLESSIERGSIITEILLEEKAYKLPVDKKEVKDQVTSFNIFNEEQFKKELQNKMDNGKVYFPEKGKVQLVTQNNIETIRDHLIQKYSSEDKGAEYEAVIEEMMNSSLERDTAEVFVKQGKKEGKIEETEDGNLKYIGEEENYLEKRRNLNKILESFKETGQETMNIDDLHEKAEEKGLKQEEVEEGIETLKREGELFEPEKGKLQALEVS